MTSLLQMLWRICTFRSGPESLPDSSFLLTMLLFTNIAISLVTQLLLTPLIPLPEDLSPEDVAQLQNAAANATRLVVTLAALSGLVWGLLSLMGFAARFNRTLAAMLGADALITLIALIALLVIGQLDTTLWQLITLGMVFWTIGVYGAILHRALEISMGFGVAAAIFIWIFSFSMGSVAVNG